MDQDGSDSNTTENAESRTAAVVGNMALAHELVMDENFKLQGLPDNSLKKHVRKIVHKAFWDKLTEELNQEPPNYEQMVSLISDLKKNILSLLQPHNRALRAQVNEVLDPVLIQQQAEHNTLDLRQCAHFIVSLLSKMCAPARDDQVKKLLQIEDAVQLFRDVFRLIDAMKIDMANFQLQAVKPQLLQQSIEYERDKFKQYIQDNPAGLTSTKVWIKKGMELAIKTGNVTKTDADSSSTSSAGISCSTDGHPTTFSKDSQGLDLVDVLSHSFLGIIFEEPGWPYPETLIVDEFRLAEMRYSVHRTVLIGSILLVTVNAVGRQVASDAAYFTKLKEAIYILLDGVPDEELPTALPSAYEQIVSTTDKFLEERGFTKLTEEQRESLKGQVTGVASADNTVRKVVTSRAHAYMQTTIKARIRHRDGRAVDDASNPVPPGLAGVQVEMSELTGRFCRIVAHNSAVYGEFYQDIFDAAKAC